MREKTDAKCDPDDPRAEVLSLRRQVESLRRRVAELERFRDSVWRGAVEGLERWAARQGIEVPPDLPEEIALRRVPLSQEVRNALDEQPGAAAAPASAAQPLPRQLSGAVQLRLERRSSTRYAVDHPVRFAAHGVPRSAAATLVQISEEAFVIHTADPPPVGSRAACGLYVGEDQTMELVLAKGQVARVLDGGAGFVLRIEQLTVAIERLVTFLAGQLIIEATRARADETTAKVRARRGRAAR